MTLHFSSVLLKPCVLLSVCFTCVQLQGLSVLQGVINRGYPIPQVNSSLSHLLMTYRANAKYFKGNGKSRNQPISFLLCTRIVFYSCCCVNVSKLACGPETRETQNIFSSIFVMFISLPYLNGDVLFAPRLQSSRCFSSSPIL